MINNNSGNKNKDNMFYRSMYVFFLILIQVNVYFLLICISINLILVLKKYTLTCINDKKINKKYT